MAPLRLHAAHTEILRRNAASLDALRRYIGVPSFSDSGEGMADAAHYNRDLLATIASDAAVVATDGFPVVFGTVPAARPNAPSLIVCGLKDVTASPASRRCRSPATALARPGGVRQHPRRAWGFLGGAMPLQTSLGGIGQRSRVRRIIQTATSRRSARRSSSAA